MGAIDVLGIIFAPFDTNAIAGEAVEGVVLLHNSSKKLFLSSKRIMSRKVGSNPC